MDNTDVEKLRAAVEHLHSCPAFFLADETVVVTVEGQPAFQHDVASFVLGKPNSPVVYAWMESGSTSPAKTVHHRVVLRDERVRTAQDAIRVALLLPPPDEQSKPSPSPFVDDSSREERRV